jgi:hypothetical protein
MIFYPEVLAIDSPCCGAMPFKDLADINFLVWMVDLPGFKNLADLGPGSYLEPNPK